MPTKTKTAKPAAKTPAKKSDPKPVGEGDLTPIDEVSITVGDAHARVKINGIFDLDGLIAVCKRVDRARAELS